MKHRLFQAVFVVCALWMTGMRVSLPAAAQSADLSLSVQPSPSTVHQGDLLTYAFPVSNLGPNNSVHEVLNTQVPAGTTFDYILISGTPGLGTCTNPPYQGTGQIICHENSSMAPNTTWTVSLTVKVTAPAGTVITESAATMADTPDPNSANNTATVKGAVSTATFSVSPINPRLAVGAKLQFQASSAATWKANCGSIVASTGAYTAPSWSGRCSIWATAMSGATATAVAEVGLPIETTAASQVHALARQQFVAGVPVTWTASCGSVTQGGLFTAPAGASTCTVTATAAGGVRRGQSQAAITLANYTNWKNSQGGVAAETDEFQLTPASVSSGRFFQSWTMAVDGAITGQPLYMNALTVAGKARNVVFVATSNDTVYAFDADIGGSALWTQHLLATGETAVPFVCVSGYTPQAGWNTFGVLSTPVINPATNTLYVVAETIEGQTHSTFPCGGQSMHHLHALDLGTGQEKLGGPVDVYSATTDPDLQPDHHLQRPALLLANNIIYIGFGASMEPMSYHGFLFAFNAGTLARQSPTLNTTPTGNGGGIWMSAEAPTADSNGDIYVPTGNGDFDGVSNFGSSVLKLSPGLQRLDFFTPYNFNQLNIGDLDVGAGNVLVVPTQTGPFPHELIVCGKPTPIYVLNRDSLGGVGTTSDHIIQRLDGQLGNQSGLPCFSTPSIWKQNIYFAASHDVMKMFTLSTVTGMLSVTPVNKGSFVYNWPGANPVISSNGNNNGVVWTVDLATKALRANDASDISKILYINSNFGTAVNWMVPTVINGHVYIGLKDEIIAYSMH